MNAIPTTYRGINFRSRLEARWAAFFDLCETRWLYEPIDLNNYIPDFLINPDNERKSIVEVKPCLGPNGFQEGWRNKIRDSGWTGAAAIVGVSVEIVEHTTRNAPLALFHEGAWRKHQIDEPDGYPERAFVCHPGDQVYTGNGENLYTFDAARLWASAGNLVQWHGAGAQRSSSYSNLGGRHER